MAGTSDGIIYDQFSMLLRDYRLTNLYNLSAADYEIYLEGWLIPATIEFSYICDQSLTYSTVTGEFTETLTSENIYILAKIMQKLWLGKEVNDVLQMRLKLQDHDFRTFSEAQNLDAKRKAYVEVKEEVSQLLLEYGYRKNNWSEWLAGVFYTAP